MLELKAMTVAGATISSSIQAKAVSAFLRKGESHRISAMELQIALEDCGAPMGSGYRGADRLIQKLRQGGFIEKTGRRWRTSESGQRLLEAFEGLNMLTGETDQKEGGQE